MPKYNYYEAKLEGVSDGPFKVFILEKDNGAKCDDGPRYSRYELTSGQYVGGVDDCKYDVNRSDTEYFAKERDYDGFLQWIAWNKSDGDKTQKKLLSNLIKYFEDLENDTQNNVLRWKQFFVYDPLDYNNHRISVQKMSKYLKEVEEQGWTQHYVDYVKSVVLNNQKEYLEAIRPHYEKAKKEYNKILAAEQRRADAKKRQSEAEKYVEDFMKTLGVEIP